MDEVDKMEPTRVDEIDGFWTYLAQIDWSEPWFKGLAVFHLVCIALTILTRQKGMLQAAHFSVLLITVYFAESINEWAAQNYRLFAKQQYFDSNGLFISVVFSTPILFNCLVMVVMWLISTGNLFVEVKKMKIRKLQKQKEKEQKKEKSKEENKSHESKEDRKNKEHNEDRKNSDGETESKKDK